MIFNDNKKRTRAILVGIQTPDLTDEEMQSSMAELGRLVHTLGFDVIDQQVQKRKAPDSGSVVGAGKLEDLKSLSKPLEGGEDTPLVLVFDVELTPTQLTNLEDATGREILDRTGVIVEIFNRHAKTREAKLQVEIAKLNYLAPRLRASRVGMDRQGGGIGAKGAGETAHELDRRRIRDRIAELRRQLGTIAQDHATRRGRRSDSPRVALVGYTNAGKSSLMRALTGSEVLVADKLFATLDTTVRLLYPETIPNILVSDTVGFIKKLPHDLVASFRSTLDEALAASLLLYVVDASDPTFPSQLEVTRTVLSEIGADEIPKQLVLNKMDLVSSEQKASLRRQYPDALMISTRSPEDVQRMHAHLLSFFEREMRERQLQVPYAQSGVLGKLRKMVRIVKEEHDDDGYNLRYLADDDMAHAVTALLAEPK